MKGIIYGVGVGPGDPELLTLKAVRLIKENNVIALPGKDAKKSLAYKTAVQAVPELAAKELIPVNMPMVRDKELLEKEHIKGVRLLESYLDKGQNIVYLTLGDPTIYCSFSYLQHILEADGYQTELVSGVTSFCAAAARLGLSLTESDEQLHIIPAGYDMYDYSDRNGTYAVMKAGPYLKDIKKMMRENGRSASAVVNCGMAGEKVFRNLEEIPDEAGYFSLVISRIYL